MRSRWRTETTLVVMSGLLATMVSTACMSEVEKEARQKTAGDPGRGLEYIAKYGCSACHVIPGVEGSIGTKGPSLKGVATRPRIGADLSNTPENVIQWLQDPHRYDKYTEMPNQGITEKEARDIAAYLYTLR